MCKWCVQVLYACALCKCYELVLYTSIELSGSVEPNGLVVLIFGRVVSECMEFDDLTEALTTV